MATDYKNTIITCSNHTCIKSLNCPNFKDKKAPRERTYHFPSCPLNLDKHLPVTN